MTQKQVKQAIELCTGDWPKDFCQCDNCPMMEAGQFRITPDEKLMAVKHDVPQPVIEWNENYHCPKCKHMLSKNRKKKTDIQLCSRCGQKVKWE